MVNTASPLLDLIGSTAPDHPYAAAAGDYVAAGWAPLPVPHGEKAPPPDGYTGHAGRPPRPDEVDTWAAGPPTNVALRLPGDVVGIDVDDGYGDKAGAASLAQLEAEFGPLPPTWSSTARGTDDGPGASRVLLFRVPMGARIRNTPAPSIEALQRHHRYLVAWPSVHPTGATYRWYDDAGEPADRVPEPDDLAELPWAWVDGLKTVGDGRHAVAAAPEAVRAFLERHTSATRPDKLTGIITSLGARSGACRHDTLVEHACWAMREAAAGYFPAVDAGGTLSAWWNRVMDDPARRDGTEFGDALAWAIAQVGADSERITEMQTAAPDDDGPPPPATLPDEFWEARPHLGHIRQAARARRVAPDAVLHAVLARIAGLRDFTLELAPTVGAPAPLNYFALLVGRPGTGKSAAVALAAELVPSPDPMVRRVVDGLALGSGEGLAEALMGDREETGPDGKTRKTRQQVTYNLIAYVDEGEALFATGKRQGATILQTLRSAWSGDTLGQANASADRTRRIPRGMYAMGLVAGIQPDRAQPLFDDATGGLPQRFAWASATDPGAPDREHLPDWPGPLGWTEPNLRPIEVTDSAGRIRHWIVVDLTIAAEVDDRRTAVLRGEGGTDLEGHDDLVRLKIGALLALLDGRLDVGAEDWALAEMMWATSRSVRDRTLATLRASQQAAEVARNEAAHRRAQVIEAGRLGASDRIARLATRLAGHVDAVGADGATRGELRRRLASGERVFVDEAIAHAVEQGWISPEQDGRHRPVATP